MGYSLHFLLIFLQHVAWTRSLELSLRFHTQTNLSNFVKHLFLQGIHCQIISYKHGGFEKYIFETLAELPVLYQCLNVSYQSFALALKKQLQLLLAVIRTSGILIYARKDYYVKKIEQESGIVPG